MARERWKTRRSVRWPQTHRWGIAPRCRVRPRALTCHSSRSAPTTTSTAAAFSTDAATPSPAACRRPKRRRLAIHRRRRCSSSGIFPAAFLLRSHLARPRSGPRHTGAPAWRRRTCQPMDTNSGHRHGSRSPSQTQAWSRRGQQRSAATVALPRRRPCRGIEFHRCRRRIRRLRCPRAPRQHGPRAEAWHARTTEFNRCSGHRLRPRRRGPPVVTTPASRRPTCLSQRRWAAPCQATDIERWCRR